MQVLLTVLRGLTAPEVGRRALYDVGDGISAWLAYQVSQIARFQQLLVRCTCHTMVG